MFKQSHIRNHKEESHDHAWNIKPQKKYIFNEFRQTHRVLKSLHRYIPKPSKIVGKVWWNWRKNGWTLRWTMDAAAFRISKCLGFLGRAWLSKYYKGWRHKTKSYTCLFIQKISKRNPREIRPLQGIPFLVELVILLDLVSSFFFDKDLDFGLGFLTSWTLLIVNGSM